MPPASVVIVPTYGVAAGPPPAYQWLKQDELTNQKAPTVQFVPVLNSESKVVLVAMAKPATVHTDISFVFDQTIGEKFINIPAINERIRYTGYVYDSLKKYQQFHKNGKNQRGPPNLNYIRPENYAVPLDNVGPPALKVFPATEYRLAKPKDVGQFCQLGIYPVLQENGISLQMAVPFTNLISDETNEIFKKDNVLIMHNPAWNISIPFHRKAYNLKQVSSLFDFTGRYYRTNTVPELTATTPLNFSEAENVPRMKIRSYLELRSDVLAVPAVQVNQAQVSILPDENIEDDLLPPPPEQISEAGSSSSKATKRPAGIKHLKPEPMAKYVVTDNKALHEFKTPDINDTIRVVAGPTNYTLLELKKMQKVIDAYMPLLDNTQPSQPVRGLVYVYNPKDPDPETSGPFLAVPIFTGKELALMVEPPAVKTTILVRYKGWAFWPLENYVAHYAVNLTNNLKRPEEYVDNTNQEPEVQLRQLESPGTGGRKRTIQNPYSAPACLRPAIRSGYGVKTFYMVVPFSEVAIVSDSFILFNNEIYLFNLLYSVMCRYAGLAFDIDMLKQPDLAECYRLRPVPHSELGYRPSVKARTLPPSPASKKRNRHLRSGVYSLRPDETLPAGSELNLVPNDSYRPVLDTDGQLYLLRLDTTSEDTVIRAKLVHIEAGQGVISRTYFCNEDKSILTIVPTDQINVWVFKGLKDTFLYLFNDQPSNLGMPSVHFNDKSGEDIETDDEEQQICTAMAARNNLTTMGKRIRQVILGGQGPPPAPGRGRGRGSGWGNRRGRGGFTREELIDQTIESVVAQTLPSGSQTDGELSGLDLLCSAALDQPRMPVLPVDIAAVPPIPVIPVQPGTDNEQQAPNAQPVVPAASKGKRKAGKDGHAPKSKK